MSYPVTADVTALLTLAGVSYGSSDVAGALDGVIREWERLTGWYPFVAATQTRYYDPADLLELDAGLLTVTTLKTGVLADGTGGTTRTAGTDYVLEPFNAANTLRPFTRVRFITSPYGLDRSVSIAGSWGFAASCPEDVVQAITRLAAARVAHSLTLGASGPVTDLKQGPVELSYEAGAGLTNREACESALRALSAEYRRVYL